MARQNRILLSVDDELHDLLKEFTAVSGVPAASFIYGLLKESQPNIKNLIDTFKIAKISPVAAIEHLEEMMTRSIHIGATAQLEMLEDKKKLKKLEVTKKKK